MRFRPIRVIVCWAWEWCIEIRDDFIYHFAVGVKNLQTSFDSYRKLFGSRCCTAHPVDDSHQVAHWSEMAFEEIGPTKWAKGTEPDIWPASAFFDKAVFRPRHSASITLRAKGPAFVSTFAHQR